MVRAFSGPGSDPQAQAQGYGAAAGSGHLASGILIRRDQHHGQGSFLGPRRSPRQTRSPASRPASQPAKRLLLYRHPSRTKHHRRPDTQSLLPPCQLICPVIDSPNLEAPCPFTGYSRGSVRRRLARGLTRWDGLGCSLSLSRPLPLSLSASLPL